jgi:hypothetical protein
VPRRLFPLGDGAWQVSGLALPSAAGAPTARSRGDGGGAGPGRSDRAVYAISPFTGGRTAGRGYGYGYGYGYSPAR